MNMVLQINPFCPISFGFLGFLGAVLSSRSALLRTDKRVDKDEEDDLLMSKQEDGECDELNEDKISHFLEMQRDKYYKSIGMDPPRASRPSQSNMNVSSSTSCTDFSTPSQSMIEFPSSRETSLFIDDSLIDPSLISVQLSVGDHGSSTVQSFSIDKDVFSPLKSDEEGSQDQLIQFRTTTGDAIVEDSECLPDATSGSKDISPPTKPKKQSSSRRSQNKRCT